MTSVPVPAWVLVLAAVAWLTAGLNVLAERESWADDLAWFINRAVGFGAFLIWLWLLWLLIP